MSGSGGVECDDSIEACSSSEAKGPVRRRSISDAGCGTTEFCRTCGAVNAILASQKGRDALSRRQFCDVKGYLPGDILREQAHLKEHLIGGLSIADLDGEIIRQVSVTDMWTYHPVWSPDGSQIAFASDRSGTMQIWVAPVANGARTGEPHQITHSKGSAIHPMLLTAPSVCAPICGVTKIC